MESGWAVPSWPKEWYGRGLSPEADNVVASALQRHGAVGLPIGVGVGLACPTMLAHASDELKRMLLAPTLTGESTWCQLFSEPGSGSDLAGLTSTAVRAESPDGSDVWVVNGQKVWNTSAHHADYGLLLARTDWNVPKHQGITCFALPMRQPGVEVRPLQQMNRHASFNEVFMSDARIPATHVIGEPNAGWPVALTTLSFERRASMFMRPRFPESTGRTVREAATEAEEYFKTYSWYPQRAGRADLAVDVARSTGRDRDPVMRQKLAALHTLQQVNQWTAMRALAARASGRPPGPEGSLAKLAASNLARTAADAHAMAAGSGALLTGPTSLFDGVVAEVLVSVPAVSIAGGTDEIQRNIIGERVLGLPREPAVDREVPFREVARNPGR
jgi:alkylation response protein AidB-like acyl-CoA dehydrogenase